MVGFPLRLSNHYRHSHDLYHAIFAPTTSIGTKHVGSDLFSADIFILGEVCHTRSHRSGATRPLVEQEEFESP